ncbi:MAG: hypothetical protein IPH75_05515 [bacterium]|nr:hypothetical protein [bacterium]
MVIVPTDYVADRFRAVGYSSEQILISGLCIEPAKVRQAVDAYHSRLHHYADNTPLTGAFFSSGAEPSDHVDKLIAAALATVAAGHSAIIFARRGRRLHRMIESRLKGTDHLFRLVDAGSDLPIDLGGITLVLHTNHREENIFSSRLFPYFDFFVAPSHERSNWAVGLGLPMFVLDPPKGSFAPLNRQFLLDRKVAFCLTSLNHAQSLGSRLDTMRHRGQLRDMAEAGWRSHDISGFETIVNFFSRKFGLSTD